MKQNYSFTKRVSAIAATSSLKSFLKSTFRIIPLLCMLALSGNAWGGAVLYSTDVVASPYDANVLSTKLDFFTSAIDWASGYNNYGKTSGSAGYYQLNFTSPITIPASGATLEVIWGATANRPLNVSINGGSATKIDEVTSSNERSLVRAAIFEIKDIALLKSLKLVSSGGGNVFLFKITVTEDALTPTTYTVTFDLNGKSGTAPAQQTIEHGSKATEPTAPTAEGFIFGGWYTDPECTIEYDFKMPVTSSFTLYAKWSDIPCFSMEITATSGSVAPNVLFTDAQAAIVGGTVVCDEHDYDTNLSFGADGAKLSSTYYLKVTLDGAVCLSAGTKVKITYKTNGSNRGIKLFASDKTTEILSVTNSKKGTFTEEKAITADIEEKVFYITRATKNETYIKSIEITHCGTVCPDPVPQIAPEKGSVSCKAVELRLLQSDGTTPVSSGKVQWYRDGVAIEGATGYTYTATTAGEYTATLEQTCTVTTSNKAVIASTVTSPNIKAFSPFCTHQITGREVDGVPVRPYSADTHYPLFTLKPTVPDDGTMLCRFTLVVRNGSNVRYTTSTPDELDWIRRDFIRDGTIHIGANYPKLGEWIRNYNENADKPFVVGDTIWLTAHPLNACGEYDMDVTATIPIKLTDKFSIAYIITGPDGGSFYEVTKDNLDAFYTNFRDKSDYEITPVNAYAPYDYYYYEPYDLVILTDYPKATGKDSKPERVNALADLVDKKPILSFKAHMAAKELDKWKALGFVGSPEVPSTGQVTMEVLCFSHEIFVEDKGNNSLWDEGSDHLITLLSATVKDDKKEKGLQGFSELSVDGFVNIATINGGPNGSKLITCCERQTNVEARMMVLSIFSGAIKNMTQAGMNAVDKILEYLLWTDPVRVSDCAVVFDNGGAEQRTGSGDNLWSNPANWQGNTLPTRLQNVRIEADCEVSGADLQVVSNVCINDKYKLTITPDGKLGSLGKFSMYTNDDQTQISDITSPDIITIQADDKGTGALLHTHAVRPLVATVQLYSKAHIEMVDGKKKNYWAYVGIPVQEAPVPQFFNGAYTWQYDETDPKAWIRYGNGTTMTAFKGYGLSQPAPQLFTLTGQLVYAQDRVVTLTKTEGAGKGQNLIGNSWTAPIQITLLEATDFGEGLQQTIYIYNTGRDAVYGEGAYGGVEDATPGQWRTIPIETAKLTTYKGPKTIPAMQAFEVDFSKGATQTTANLTLEYNRVVRTSKGTDLNMPLYAPRRKAQAVTDEPELMRICVEDSRTRTELYLLQDGRFTDDFDNGWDGFYMEGNGPAAGLWAFTPVGDMAVSAQPAIDGTTLGFRPGRENLYTFSFQWEGEVLYLNDMLLRQSVQIRTGNTYAFTAFDNEAENRFVISHEPCSEVNTSLADIVLTGDLLTLNNPAGELLDVLVYDPAGRICTTRQTADNLVKLDLPAIQGVYMVCVRTTDGNKVYKVVR